MTQENYQKACGLQEKIKQAEYNRDRYQNLLDGLDVVGYDNAYININYRQGTALDNERIQVSYEFIKQHLTERLNTTITTLKNLEREFIEL